MELNEINKIRDSANPIQEIVERLRSEKIGGSDAVNTGLLDPDTIHLFVLFCMTQAVEQSQTQDPLLKTEEVHQVLVEKMRFCEGIRSEKDRKRAYNNIMRLINKHEDALYHREATKTQLSELCYALAEDPYEAHNWTNFEIFPYTKMSFPFDDIYAPLDLYKMFRDLDNISKGKREFMADLLTQRENTKRNLYQHIEKLFNKKNPSEMKSPQKSKPKKKYHQTIPPPKETKQKNLSTLQEMRKKQSDW